MKATQKRKLDADKKIPLVSDMLGVGGNKWLVKQFIEANLGKCVSLKDLHNLKMRSTTSEKDDLSRTMKIINETTGKASEEDKKENESDKKLTLVQKFKLMYKQYWYVLIPVHVVTSVIWYGSFFFAAKSGFDVVPFLEKIGTSEKFLYYLRDNDAGYYGIAYAMYKIATPARYTVTLGGTTISINYFKNRGYIKPVPSKDELKIMYQDKKEEIKDRTDEMKEKYIEKRDKIRGRYQEKRGEIFEKYHDRTSEITEKYHEKKKTFLHKLKRRSQKTKI